MPDATLGTALAVLRLVRGLNQEELSKSSGIRSGTISDYERGKMVPGLKTLQKLLAALDFPLSAVGQTQAFIEALRGTGASLEPLEGPPGLPLDLRREVEQVSVEAGRILSRAARLMFLLMSEGGGGGRPQPGG
ncbi:MAG TPA: helix-turn-helix transcriptional regulator [Thermoanaerobaculia bacterium]|nr:helix-turn-helix transcriptional regulator [Thermoanaerobaculia bacterium]